MTRRRLGKIAGVGLVAVGAAIPVVIFALTAGTYLPYQDPTAEMLAEQARDIARADRMFAAGAAAGGVLIVIGVALLAGIARHRRRGPHGHLTITKQVEDS